ncbi:MAG: hypothetical protein WBQ29_14290, partial [Isosphaeraceae bacterium]
FLSKDKMSIHQTATEQEAPTMAATTVPEMRTFMISEEERVEMVRLLEQSLKETRGEIHKTHTPDYRDRVIGQETLLRGLLVKLQRVGE